MNKIKVVWICHLSNEKLRKKLDLKKHPIKSLLKLSLNEYSYPDIANWNTFAIEEFEKFDDIELFVISPHLGMNKQIEKFDMNNIHYIFFKSQDENFISYFEMFVLKKYNSEYERNRMIISQIINCIKPQIIHLIGAENPYYSLSALDVQNDVKLITSLQTLMSYPNFYNNYPINKSEYDYRSKIEQKIIIKSDYIATSVEVYRNYILKNIKNDAKFFPLFFVNKIDFENLERKIEFDFVYFAKDISKSVDLAIEALGIVCQTHPNVHLNIIGKYGSIFKKKIDSRIKELNIEKNVSFSGLLPTRDDVIKQVYKSRFALLPLKVDFISSTITESLMLGIPVITTITEGTPTLNRKRETVLLSEIGDNRELANNMIKLLDSPNLQKKLIENISLYCQEQTSNMEIMNEWRKTYFKICNYLI